MPDFISLKGGLNNTCPYLRRLKAAEKIPIHLMHKAMLLNESRKAERYDLIVVDEELAALLSRSIRLGLPEIDTWLAKMKSLAAYPHLPGMQKHLKLATLLRDYVVQIQTAGTDAAPPVVEGLEELAGRSQVDLSALVKACLSRSSERDPKCGLYAHENPRGARAVESIPVRAWQSLLTALDKELTSRSDDHLLHLIRPKRAEAQANQVQIQIQDIRVDLLETLRRKTIINLDATPNLPRLKQLFRVRDAGIPVRENVVVLQCTDAFFGKSAAVGSLSTRLVRLVRHALERTMTERIGVLAQRATLAKLKLIDPKTGSRIEGPLPDQSGPPIPSCDRVVLGYWGRDERATNIYESCAALIVSGLHVPPIDEVEREIQAWRRYLGLPRPPQSSAESKDRPYGYVDELGLGRCYRCPAHPDPDVDAELARLWSANLRQAIGRLRGTRADTRKLVVVDCAMPAEGVRVSALGALEDLKGDREPLSAEREAAQARSRERLLKLLNLARPVYQVLKRKFGRAPTRVALILALRQAGIRLSDWECRRALGALRQEDGNGGREGD